MHIEACLADKRVVLEALHGGSWAFEAEIAAKVSEDWIHNLYLTLIDDIDGVCDESVA